MKTVLALIVAATLGMSSIAFAADTVAPPAAPMATAPVAHSAPVTKTMHHKKAKKEVKKADKTAPVQKAQAAKKHHKKAAHTKSAPAAVPAVK